MLRVGVIGTSRKENERRVAVHPRHLDWIPEGLRKHMVFEKGYGEPFGESDAELAKRCGGLASREDIFKQEGMVLLIPKPSVSDLQETREGGVVWGWQHCVQQRAATQAAIDRKLTLIAFEEMFFRDPDGLRSRHSFYKNNELAGYCAVLHALQLMGTDGHYGRQRKVVILSFGAVSRGAIYALKARGFRDITICIQRPDQLVREEVLGCHYLRIVSADVGEARMLAVEHDGSKRPLLDVIAEADILLNGTFQDPTNPLMFVTEKEVHRLKPGCIIIDVSCDEGMAFSFAKPTTFDDPIFKVGRVHYYGVDHTPTYLWESASWEISISLIGYLATVMGGPEVWKKDETIHKAIEIMSGEVRNRTILSFQKRAATYPHAPL